MTPYIETKDRPRLDEHIKALNAEIVSPGELNYVMSRLAWSMIERLGGRYAGLNAVMGVFTCAALECYRRVGVELENNAIARNGDIV